MLVSHIRLVENVPTNLMAFTYLMRKKRNVWEIDWSTNGNGKFMKFEKLRREMNNRPSWNLFRKFSSTKIYIKWTQFVYIYLLKNHEIKKYLQGNSLQAKSMVLVQRFIFIDLIELFNPLSTFQITQHVTNKYNNKTPPCLFFTRTYKICLH